MSDRTRVIRWTWLALVVLVAVRVVAAARVYLLEVRVPCPGNTCPAGPPQMTSHEMHLLQGMGIPLDAYALYFAAVSTLFITVNCVFAAVLLWKKPDDRMAVITAFTLTLFSGFALGLPSQLFQEWAPVLWVPAAILGFLGSAGMLVMFYLFPDARLVPRWPAVLLAFYAITQVPSYLDPTATDIGGVVGAALAIGILATFLSVIYAQIYRYRRVSLPYQREQTKWVVYGISVTVLGWIGMLVFFNVVYGGNGEANPVTDMVSMTVGTFVWLVVVISMVVAILRYRLWEIDTLINRTLVYASLILSLAAIYIGAVIGLQALSRAVTGQHSDLAIALATLAVAAVFNPWRRRVHTFIDRRFYRRKYDAGKVLAEFQTRLRNEVDLEQLTGDLVMVAADTVQPASVSLWLAGGARAR